MRKFFLIAFFIVLFDQISKYFAVHNLSNHQSIIGSFLQFHLTGNTGASFGLFQGSSVIISIISVAAIIAITYYLPKISVGAEEILFALILGGIIGNLLDRVIRGYVVDFIAFNFWPVFNIADSAITIGVLGLLIYYTKKEYFKN